MRVLGERGAPGVQDREDTDAGAEVFGIGRDGEHGLGRSLEQDTVDCGLVLVGDIGDLSRQREHDVEVGHRQELSLALGQPLARGRSLALRTVPIATGVVADLRVTARLVLTAYDMAAELCRAAVLDRRHHLELLKADMAGIGLTPCRSVAAEDIYCLLSQSFFGEYSCLSKDSELVRMDRACRRARVCQGRAFGGAEKAPPLTATARDGRAHERSGRKNARGAGQTKECRISKETEMNSPP